MANVVGDIAISVGADIGPLVTGLGKGQAAVSRFGGTAQATANGGMRAMTLAGAALAGAAVTAGLGLAALTRRSMENIDAVSKSARVLGVHTANLQAMAQVANEAGVETDALTKAMVKMQDNVANLGQGTAAQVTAFERLGLSIQDLNGLSADAQFELIAQQIAAIQDPAQRTSSALDIFGKAGAGLIPMFDGYSAALANATQYQRDFGIAVSDLGGQEIERANDAIGRLSGSVQGLGNALAVEFAPVLADMAQSLTDFLSHLHKTEAEINQMALDITFADLSASLDSVEESAMRTAQSFLAFGDGQISQALALNAQMIHDTRAEFDAGKISAEEYKAKVEIAVRNINNLYTILNQVSGTDMSGAMEEMGGLAGAIDVAFGAAARLLEKLKSLAGVPPPSGGVAPPATAPNGPAFEHGGRMGDATAPAVETPLTLDQIIANDAGTGTGSSGGGGGGGGSNLEAELNAMRESFKSEMDLVEEQHQERLAKLEEFRQAKLLTEAQYNDMEAAAKAEHEQALADMEAQAQAVKLDAIRGAFGDLGSLMSSHNEKLFKIGKAASLASAIVDGYKSATAAWEKGMEIGGPGVAAAFTAASLAKTGAMIAGISRTQIGGSSAPSAGGGGAPAISAPSAPLDVRLTGFGPNDLISGGMIGNLLDKLSAEAGDRGYRIMVAA